MREAPRLASALVEALPVGDEDGALLLAVPGEPGARGARVAGSELTAIEAVWEARWSQLLDAVLGDPATTWRRAVAEARSPGPVDLVLLVDLSESMSEEIPALRASLARVVPPLLRARLDLRMGWIGYRDEVVDREDLGALSGALLPSFERWRCEGGGDVPEGVDEALFEALRVGGFEWRTGAEHRLLVLGDAPPPYERIADLVELGRAAHSAPERFTIDTVGLIREPERPEVPGFRSLAKMAGGEARFLPSGAIEDSILWELLLGASGPRWEDRPRP